MFPIRLQMENFGCHGKTEISFDDFQSALIIGKIRGNEKDSNASGKSTIFAAIKYVLFNRIDASALDRSIRRGCDRSLVVFEFKSSVDNSIYKIERYRDRKTADVRLFRSNDNTWDDISQRTASQTEVEILKVLKMNYEVFNNSILFSQSDLYGIASLTPGKRKQALKDVLQLNAYSKFEKLAKKRLDEIVKEVDKTNVIISTIGSPDEAVISLGKELVDISANLTSKQYELDVKKSSFKLHTDKHTELLSKFNTHHRQNAEMDGKKKAINEDIRKLTSTCNDYDSKISGISKSGKEISNSINAMTTELKSLADKSYRQIVDIKSDLIALSTSILDKQVELKTKTIELDGLLVPLPSDSECYVCRSILTSEHIERCKVDIAAKIVVVKSTITTIKDALHILGQKQIVLNKELSDCEKANTLIQSKTNSITFEKKNLEAKKSLHREYTSILSENKLRLNEKKVEFNKINSIPSIDLNDLNRSINESKTIISKSELDIDTLNKSISTLSSTKSVILHKLDDKNNDIIKLKSMKHDLSILKSKLTIHGKVVEAFGPAGIPALITHTILDDFQIEANHLLLQLFPGLQLKFSVVKDRSDGDKDDTLDISYMLNGNNDLEYAELSGAQKLIVSLCFKLGLAAVINKRLGIEIRLLLIDEVDQSLDDGRLEIFEDAIKKLQSQYKILIITHNKELKDKFSHAIVVEQDENFVSSAKVVSQW